ncbi:MAG: AmmeMemoRadiSam system radical SAM enzyme, partial [Candidatus Aenigmatarchaeota archaeon]
TPIHFSRFHPDYKVKDIEATPIETIEKAIKIARDKGMYYVYGGNVPGHKSESTFCPNCDELLIKRNGLRIEEFNIDRDMRCSYCGEEVDIKGKAWIPNRLFEK